MRKYLFNTEKIKYVLGKKPNVDCILCSIIEGSPEVQSLEVFRTNLACVTVNLYPFNPGHLLIFPIRHVEKYDQLTDDEALEIHRLLKRSVVILKKQFSPCGFNIGYNLEEASGASISHIHAHIVPRYKNEVGFIDVLAGDRIVVVDPAEVMERLISSFKQ